MAAVDPNSRRSSAANPVQALELSREASELAALLGSQVVELHRARHVSNARTPYRSPGHLDLGLGHGGGGHGDPVGDFVAIQVDMATDGRGLARRAYTEGVDTLEAVVVLLRSATGGAGKVLDPQGVAGPEDEGCTSHALHGFFGVPTRTPGSDLCRYCADFWKKYRQRPSKNDLELLEEKRDRASERRAA